MFLEISYPNRAQTDIAYAWAVAECRPDRLVELAKTIKGLVTHQQNVAYIPLIAVI